MLDVFRRRSESVGLALFRGSTPHALDLEALADRGVTGRETAAPDGVHWAATLEHPEWGRAEVACPRDPPRADRQLLELDPKLEPDDVDAICDCGVVVSATSSGKEDHVLRDRKRLLRFLDALAGENGVAIVDTTAGPTYWTREALEDELAHDADLDVESIYTIHAVSEPDGEVSWFHTHGLGELGRFDFDILSPSPEFMETCGWFTRALAFAILEGAVSPGDRDVIVGRPLPPIHLVPAEEFMRTADPELRELRDDPDGWHRDRRVVLCDPPGTGLLGRLFRSGSPRPSRTFRSSLPENVVFDYSADASALMGERARKTTTVLASIAEEVRELELPILVKLAFDTTDGGREHLWFEVHHLEGESVDATLVNQPCEVPELNEGDRGHHSLDRLSDWTVLTPFGPITPHAVHARRLIRRHRDEMLAGLEKSRRDDG